MSLFSARIMRVLLLTSLMLPNYAQCMSNATRTALYCAGAGAAFFASGALADHAVKTRNYARLERERALQKEQDERNRDVNLEKLKTDRSNELKKIKGRFAQLPSQEEGQEALMQCLQGWFSRQPLASGTTWLNQQVEALINLEPVLEDTTEKTLCQHLLNQGKQLSSRLGDLNKKYQLNEREEANKIALDEQKLRHQDELHEKRMSVEEQRKNLLKAEETHSTHATRLLQAMEQKSMQAHQATLGAVRELRNNTNDCIGRLNHQVEQRLARVDMQPIANEVAALRNELGLLKATVANSAQTLNNEIQQVPNKVIQSTNFASVTSTTENTAKVVKSYEARFSKIDKKLESLASKKASTPTQTPTAQTSTSTTGSTTA